MELGPCVQALLPPSGPPQGIERRLEERKAAPWRDQLGLEGMQWDPKGSPHLLSFDQVLPHLNA